MSDTKVNMKVGTTKPLPSAEEPPPFPSWCKKVANEPQTVRSLLTQESVLLSAEEVSMYRWLFEAYFNFLYRPERLSNDPNVKQKYEEGMKWFDSTNPKALDALFP